jgi:phosphatidylglycerol---prolipoprotein diacylglyceryl transferase
MTFPNISPIAFEIGPIAIHWYALAYVVGILLAQKIIGWVDDYGPSPQRGEVRRGAEHAHRELSGSAESARYAPILTKAARDDMVLYGVLGIILGGRLGYVLFYNFDYYIHHLSEILHVWQGGMSFHGGLLGVLAAFWLFARRYRLNWLQLMDRIAIAAPVGLFLGRLANFVNGELYGRVTDVPWGIIFPHGGPLPRHPSQLYEAGLEGLVLGFILWFLATRTRALHRIGTTSGVFILGYAISRFMVEFVREPDVQLGFLSLGLTMGQWLCVPMTAAGIWVIVTAKGRRIA